MQPLSVQTQRDATYYKMDHPRRGMALIFNHQIYEGNYMPPRQGTTVDSGAIQNSLMKLGFDVKVFNNYSANSIESKLQKVSQMDHTHYDCFVTVMLTHGEYNKLYAFDKFYSIDTIFGYFTAERCPSLVGKPKIFFIQACRGDEFDDGVSVIESHMDTDGEGAQAYRIPAHADFLIAYSTVPGFVSWRNEWRGSWFIEALCAELNDNGTKFDLLSLLTFVARRVAIFREAVIFRNGSIHRQKQIPCTNSMLMRIIHFTPPRSEGSVDDPEREKYSSSAPY